MHSPNGLSITNSSIGRSRLFGRLVSVPHLVSVLDGIRSRATQIGAFSIATQPTMTDHTGLHFDKLWTVADVVLEPDETERLTPMEAFLLGACFYVHDLGMSIGYGEADRVRLRETVAYKTAANALLDQFNVDELALQYAIRATHAYRASELCVKPLGTSLDEWLIEKKADRDLYGDHIGTLSESHHWSLLELKHRIGDQGRIPIGTEGATADLGLVAALLRIIDFAHISRDRAPTLSRSLRPSMPRVSQTHWLAQERVSGPMREGHYLKYSSLKPIADVDAWWLFYGLVRGLDEEIRLTRRFLDSRLPSAGWLSLGGVYGASGPEEMAQTVRPEGFVPIDVQVKAGSISRIVELLGGRTLYGSSCLPAIRELVQNAIDAVRLRRLTTREWTGGDIEVEFLRDGDKATLEISDDGIGMNEVIVRDHLLAVASEYWKSEGFISEVGADVARTFRPAGRFGVGFLAVFMLGEIVRVESCRFGFPTVALGLRGTDRIGELRLMASRHSLGTNIKIDVTREGMAAKIEAELPSVAALVPMTDVNLTIRRGPHSETLIANTWKEELQQDFIRRLGASYAALRVLRGEEETWSTLSARIARALPKEPRLGVHSSLPHRSAIREFWRGDAPGLAGDDFRIVAMPSSRNLVGCSRGIVVSSLECRGFAGLVDTGDAAVDVSRSRFIGFDLKARRDQWLVEMGSEIRSGLERVAKLVSPATMHARLRDCMDVYGQELLWDSDLRWIWWLAADWRMAPLSAIEYSNRIKSAGKFCYVHGMGPFGAMKAIDARPDLRDVPCVIQPDAPTPKFSVEKEDEDEEEEKVHNGELKVLWPDFRSDTMLQSVLSLAARAQAVALDDYLATSTQWTVRIHGRRYSRTAELIGVCTVSSPRGD